MSSIQPRSLTAAILTICVICAIIIPILIACVQCAKEAEIVTRFLINIIESDELLQEKIESVISSNIYRNFHDRFRMVYGESSFPNELNHATLKKNIKNNIRQLALFIRSNMKVFSSSIFNFLSNVSNIIWGCTTFSTTLFYLLNNQNLWSLFSALSPLSPDDNIELYESTRASTIRILLCSIAMLSIHFSVMYLILSFSGLDIVAIPSLISGLFAVLPFFGTYVVFLPMACLLWAKGHLLLSIILCIVEFFMMLIVDSKITSYITGDSHFVALSAVAGLYSYGFLGFLYGPLLVVLAGTVIKIYVKYLKKPLQYDLCSPSLNSLAKRPFKL